MSAADSTSASGGHVEILPSVRHHSTAGFAMTWDAYDALTEMDGWIEQIGPLGSAWKQGLVNGRVVIVHAPTSDREPAA